MIVVFEEDGLALEVLSCMPVQSRAGVDSDVLIADQEKYICRIIGVLQGCSHE
jgi:hypothetical protein